MNLVPGFIAIPYPFESIIPPTCVRSHFLSIKNSIVDDSIKNAYNPFESWTRLTPSIVLLTNGLGFWAEVDRLFDSMKDHIR